jgi:hypothetical protein
MRTNKAIERFAQTLYTEFGVSSISYGYNHVSETYIVRIDDDNLMSNEQFLEKVFDFTHDQADKGEWIMFISPSDNINFNDYQLIVREFATANTLVEPALWMLDLVNMKDGWAMTSINSLARICDKSEFSKEEMDYPLAA